MKRWKEVQQILADALELPAEQQQSFVEESCGDDPVLLREVEDLLEAYHQANTFLDRPALSEFPAGLPDVLVGAQFGPYQLVELIGQGGMGAVYRAERNDGQFAQQVAVKLVQPGFRDVELLRRLRSERQILASLSHPNIGRLLDGGVSTDGQPYVVMEYIRGTRITAYCEKHDFSIAQRLELFQQVCSAVSYAHQRLIVHRDIKPGNILVTDEGEPKLLDFGIAKILSPSGLSGEEETLTQLNPLTPDYASPEQLRGEAITTATDIYSLGVLLYELLTSQKPYQLKDKTPHQVMEIVCHTDPERPSTAAKRAVEEDHPAPMTISPDLDAIVLKALRKEPEQRYASVEKFSEDIGNFLAARPVSAQQGNWRYVTGKFVRRHRVGVLMSAAMALLLMTGVSAVLWQAHVARMQRARAEQRFNDVRKLANSLIFEVHDGVVNLPGSTPVRKLIVQRAAEYLDSLSQEASGDSGLQVELAGAYIRLAQVQGSSNSANLGDTPGAEQSYAKSQALLRSVLAREPLRDDANGLLARSYRLSANLYNGTHRYKEAAEAGQEAMAIDQALMARHPGNDFYVEALAGAWYALADVHESAGNPESPNERAKALQLYEELLARDPGSPVKQRNVALAEKTLGAYLQTHGSVQQAPIKYLRSKEMDQKRVGANPNDALAALDLSFDLGLLGDYYFDTGDWQNSLQYNQRALEIRQRLAAADPNDVLMPKRIVYTRLGIGSSFEKLGKLDAARQEYQKAIDAAEPLASGPIKGSAWDYLGRALQQMGNLKDEMAARASLPQAQLLHKQACADYAKAYPILHGNSQAKSASEANEKALKHCPGEISAQR